MAAAVLQEPDAPETTRITQVEDLPDPVRADIIARRQAGETLAELKTRFAHVDPTVIREVLPPANARERKQREAKQAKAAEVTKGIGGRSAEKQSEPKQPKAEQPKEPKAERYVEDPGDLPERAVAARQVMGRNALAEALGITGSACWRAEQGRIHEDEAEALKTGLAAVEKRIAAGEFVKAEKQPKAKAASKADLEHRIDTAVAFVQAARGDKGVTKSGLIDGVLTLMDPPAEQATETQ
jgi:hypothetical protein